MTEEDNFYKLSMKGMIPNEKRSNPINKNQTPYII